ncbi:MAG: hypothetical protein RLZZ333_858, partial [Bacteroidota bacterium]
PYDCLMSVAFVPSYILLGSLNSFVLTGAEVVATFIGAVYGFAC